MTMTEQQMLAYLERQMEDYTPFNYAEEDPNEVMWDGESYAEDDDLDVTEDDMAVAKSEGDSFDATFIISKAEEKKGLVFGWASVIMKNGEVVADRENDIIDDEWEMEKAAYKFVVSGGTAGHEHVRKGVATLVESMAFTTEKIEALELPSDFPRGWWLGFKITDKEVMKNMSNGKYTGFSVHGTGKRTVVSKAKSSMSYNDMREAIQAALREQYPSGTLPGTYRYTYVQDFADGWVIFNLDDAGKSTYYKASVSFDSDGAASIGFNDMTEVRSKTTYVKKGDYDNGAVSDVLSRAKAAMRGVPR